MAKGRGRLSAIEKLPREAADIVVWADRELAARERDQIDIYREFFDRLQQLQAEHHGELEFAIPSKSAFNRYSISQAVMRRRMDDTRMITGAIAESFDAEASDDLTLIAAEAIKTLVFELLTDAGRSGIDPRGAKNLADALRATAQAQGVSTARRERIEASFRKEVGEAVDQVAKVKGLTAETAEAIKAQVLGIRQTPSMTTPEPGDGAKQ